MHGTAPVSGADLQRRPSLVTLVLIAAVGPLAMNLFVPSMPSIARDFGAPYAVVQLGLSGYLFLIAALQIVIGPLSDRYGRRPVVIGAFWIYLAGTAVSMLAPTVEIFLAGRFVQATAAAGIVLSRAIVRDCYPREKAASVIGYVVMGMSVAPMIGPAIGGLIDESFGWRASFGLLAATGLLTVLMVHVSLPETNLSASSNVLEQMRQYRSLLGRRDFWLFTAVAAATSSVFFALLGGGPAVAEKHFMLGPSAYGLYFAVTAAGYMSGNFLTGRYATRFGVNAMMIAGTLVTVLGGVMLVALMVSGASHPAAFFGPTVLVGVGNGMTLPNAMAAAVSINPQAAGAASGLLGAIQMGFGAAMSVIAAILVGVTGEPVPLAVFMLGLAVLGAMLAFPARVKGA